MVYITRQESLLAAKKQLVIGKRHIAKCTKFVFTIKLQSCREYSKNLPKQPSLLGKHGDGLGRTQLALSPPEKKMFHVKHLFLI